MAVYEGGSALPRHPAHMRTVRQQKAEKGNISTIDFSDDVPGAEFILTPPPAVAAGFELGWLRSPCISSVSYTHLTLPTTPYV